MGVSLDVTWVGDAVGFAAAPVGVALDVTGVDAGVGVSFVGVEAGVGPGVGVSDASVWTGVGGSGVGDGVVVASGVCELAGNAVVAAPSLGVAARISCGVSGGSGVGADVAIPAGSRYRRHRPSWGRGLLPAGQHLSACLLYGCSSQARLK